MQSAKENKHIIALATLTDISFKYASPGRSWQQSLGRTKDAIKNCRSKPAKFFSGYSYCSAILFKYKTWSTRCRINNICDNRTKSWFKGIQFAATQATVSLPCLFCVSGTKIALGEKEFILKLTICRDVFVVWGQSNKFPLSCNSLNCLLKAKNVIWQNCSKKNLVLHKQTPPTNSTGF